MCVRKTYLQARTQAQNHICFVHIIFCPCPVDGPPIQDTLLSN